MAKIYPDRLPEYVLQDHKRSAERKVYEHLRHLSDAYHVFYSVAWLSRRPNGSLNDGEADFVIAHPNKGIMVLEIKGGSISYDGDTGQWYSTDRYGDTHQIKDPVEQARRNKHALFRKLQELPGWTNEWLTLAHAVVFPDIISPRAQLKPDLPSEIIIDHNDIENINGAIDRVFGYFTHPESRKGALGIKRLTLVTNLLANSFYLRTPLGVELTAEDERLVELTEQQMRILDVLNRQRRVAIEGCAGSGKTMLAIEKARRLAKENEKVLLTCFNWALADYLNERVGAGVTVKHFHGLCKEMGKKANIKGIPPVGQEYYDIYLPEMLEDAILEIGAQYDAIIVDEGQDFRREWLYTLLALLHDPDHGIFYFFFDDNQNIYHGFEHISEIISQPPYPLTVNCRNTQQIHQLVASFHPSGDRLECLGPPGHRPERIPYTSDSEMLRKLRQKLHELINHEMIAPEDIAILTPKGERRTTLIDGLRLGNFQVSRSRPILPNQIWTTTIHAFKGLERKVIIMAEVDEKAHHDIGKLFYVGCSRARTYLVLLYQKDFTLPDISG